MDLEDQNSSHKSNGSTTPVDHSNSKLDDLKGKGIEMTEPVDNSSPIVKSSPTTKGFGLKKWKRIKRGARKDGESSVDSDKLLKRGLSNLVANSARPVHFPAGSVQKSDGSVSSTNAVFRSTGGVLVDGGFGVIEAGFVNAGTESENSEDRSSKSSTAASAPKARYEAPVFLGYPSDKHGFRSLSGKNLGTSTQGAHQGKGLAEPSKKARGARVKIEKENSHSSMESDSRSSNFIFMQGGNSVTSNGTKGERSMIYDGGEFSDEAQDRERSIGEELRAGLERRNDGESENVSQEDLASESPWEVKEEKSENGGSSTDPDPLMESIFSLQAAQESLERELQKFKEIGKDVIFGHSLEDVGMPSGFTPDASDFLRPSTSEQSEHRDGAGHDVQSEHRDGAGHSLNSSESKVISLKQNIILLQSQLQDAADLVKAKEARVAELEAILGTGSKKQEKTVDFETQQSTGDMESELEGLFRQKIEAEVQYLAISRTAQKLRAAAVDQVTLLEEQKALASEQAQMVDMLGDAEAKAAMLKTQAEKLETCFEDIASVDEKLNLQKRVYKYGSCFLIQLVLLAVVLGLLLMQISPDYAEVVPT